MLIRPSRVRARRGAPWTIAEIKQLGKKPDSVLAVRFKRTIQEVMEQREAPRIGLPSCLRLLTTEVTSKTNRSKTRRC